MSRSLGEILRAARERAGLTLQEVADRSGTSLRAYQKYESGERDSPRVEKLAALARVFGMTLDDLVRGASEIGTGNNLTVPQQKRLTIAQLLYDAPKTEAELITAIRCEPQGFASTLNHKWFTIKADGKVYLTAAGRAAVTSYRAQHQDGTASKPKQAGRRAQ